MLVLLETLPLDIAKGIMLLRTINLIKGYSGVRRIVVDTLVEMINKDVSPWYLKKVQ